MLKNKKITFFMLITNRDCIIADYAISSYQKIYDVKRDFGSSDFVLFLYLNCLSRENKHKYLDKWNDYPFTELYDNSTEFKSGDHPYPGQKIVSPEGIERSRDDYAVCYDELWTTELKKFQTPLVATVDADFEILHPDFYFYLVEKLGSDPSAIGASTSFDETRFRYDTYSKRDIILSERNHTWFCIYKSTAFNVSSVSHFYYEEVNTAGQTVAYDSAAYFQHDLKTKHGLSFITLPPEYNASFVHYGASSKNKSLTAKNIAFYRFIFLCSQVGWLYGRSRNFTAVFMNKVVRWLTGKLYGRYLQRFNLERSTYIYDQG